MAALSAAEQELQQFWATAKLRMQQLGYSSAERGEIKGLLMGKTLTNRKQYFDGDDDEVRSALNQLLTPGRSAHEAPPGPRHDMTREQRVQFLISNCSSQLRKRLQVLPERMAKRSMDNLLTAAVVQNGATFVTDIGQYFALQGLEGAVLQLFQQLHRLEESFRMCPTAAKPLQATHILKLVAAPGMGKSTALGALWPELFKFMSAQAGMKSALAREESHMFERVMCSCHPDKPLVFILDLKEGLRYLCAKEQKLNSSQVLALRMLYSALYDNDTMLAYTDFVDSLAQQMSLAELQPLDVLQFVQSASGCGDRYAMAVWAWDGVNAVEAPPGGKSWVQEALECFAILRCEAGKALHKIMPVMIVASTLASATLLKETASSRARVGNIQLPLMSYRHSKAILVNVCQRVQQPKATTDALHAEVRQVLKVIYGIPRYLAWAIHCLSNFSRLPSEERLMLGADKADPCPWLCDGPTRPQHAILELLISEVVYRAKTAAWLSEDYKADIMGQILAHAVLERKVQRDGIFTEFTRKDNSHVVIRWQAIEDAGFCTLLGAGATVPNSSTASSRHSSAGGASSNMGSGSTPQPDADAEATVMGWLKSAVEQHGADVDSQENAVFMCPLLALAAMRRLRVGICQLQEVPLAGKLMDCPRSREYSDLAVLLLRLCLAGTVLQLSELPLAELLPHGAKLPANLQQVKLCLPQRQQVWPAQRFRQCKPLLTLEKFEQHCQESLNSEHYAYIGGGKDAGPDSWMVLRTVDTEPLVLCIQSKKRQRISDREPEQVQPQQLDAEAKKCWGHGTNIRRLLLYVTDQRIDAVDKLYWSEAAGLHVIVVGRPDHDSFYTHAGAVAKRCLEFDDAAEKQKKAKG